ncbi:YaaR family protein [Clostridium sp. Marseille-Q2269]|uniref:YaaR family protein n=1 Tax=Clostridium sp. Marseille-Q2269 TaxID=2942205 RepID=UPI0020741897|nr:YaaR family protein [Clostridium sp. Marseille-Q2269]
MEIKRVGSNSPIQSENKRSVENKRGFSQNFNFARQKKSEQELKNMLDSIKKKGNRLAITKCYADVRAYKRMIKEYLKSVLEYMYSVKKDISFWQTQYFITVETVDEKLEELTEMLISSEKENLDIARTIDDITGLIVDIYK